MKKPLIGITANIKHDKKYYKYFFKKDYIKCVEECGGEPVKIFLEPESIRYYLKKLDGLLIPGCNKDIKPSYYKEEQLFKYSMIDKRKTDFEIKIVRAFYKVKKPVLGICHGCQLINVAFGGSLYQHIPTQVGNKVKHSGKEKKGYYHKIRIEKDSVLQGILGKGNCVVNSSHHQGINQIGKGLKEVSYSKDGLCEAIEHENAFILGLQWHPEIMRNKDSYRIFEAFIKSCK